MRRSYFVMHEHITFKPAEDGLKQNLDEERELRRKSDQLIARSQQLEQQLTGILHRSKLAVARPEIITNRRK